MTLDEARAAVGTTVVHRSGARVEVQAVADPYVRVRFEGRVATTSVRPATLSPEEDR